MFFFWQIFNVPFLFLYKFLIMFMNRSFFNIEFQSIKVMRADSRSLSAIEE